MNPIGAQFAPVGAAGAAASSASSTSQSTKTSSSSSSSSAASAAAAGAGAGAGAGGGAAAGAGAAAASTSSTTTTTTSTSKSAASSSSAVDAPVVSPPGSMASLLPRPSPAVGMLESPALAGATGAAAAGAAAGAAAASSMVDPIAGLPNGYYGNPLVNAALNPSGLGVPAAIGSAAAASDVTSAIRGASLLGAGNPVSAAVMSAAPAMSTIGHEAAIDSAAASSALAGAGAVTGAVGAANAIDAAGATTTASALGEAAAIAEANAPPAVGSSMLARQALATDALSNAQAESTIAGADMVAHGANNARSAALASNAYRQAKLASARDRVNIAGTIQNSARISDAAIATHDAATKAEDSLLGSELAVDSAATVLDSDGAFIPPVTSSLLRSLPYGRLNIRNIIPKPLTYPSVLLPDVWLNGVPVSYLNVPFRMLPFGVGPVPYANPLLGAGVNLGAGMSLATGNLVTNQVLTPNNGFPLNTRYFDPTAAYIVGAARGVLDSSILPVLANGQLEAHDEVALANMIRVQQENGPGMMATHGGYGKINSVPMLTGTVSDVNLMPTTTTATTYPIGSALVVEPRDSFFQDYIDNASSRQNFDERSQ